MATEHDRDEPVTGLNRPRPMSTLLAAATRLTSRHINNRRGGITSIGKSESWQDDAWDCYNLVGEERFLATSLSGRVAQAPLFVAKLPDDPTETPVPVEDGPAVAAFETFGGSPAARAQMILRLAINLFVAGDGWMVGIPDHLIHPNRGGTTAPLDPDTGISPQPSTGPAGTADLADLDWRMFSVSEVTVDQSDDQVTLDLGAGEKITASVDDLFMIRVWRPHPRRWWEADSPTRSSLPVLRELIGLTMHVSAQVDSRLAGAGVFIVPQSAKEAFLRNTDTSDLDDDEDPFTEALMEAMLTPISDRSNASALVPLVLTVPDEVADKFTHLKFSSELDAEARELRDEAIRRLALGQDAPPEVLLGVGDSSHWSAWLTREETITSHVEPTLALICDALTTQFLWPVLIDQGMSEDEAHQYVIWYDPSPLILRPNKSQAAFDLYDRGELTGEALRASTGFGDDDAPPALEELSDPAMLMAFKLIEASPGLVANPGIPAVVAQVRAALVEGEVTGPDLPGTGGDDAAEAPIEPSDEVDEAGGTGDDGGASNDALPSEDDTAGPPSPETGEPAGLPASAGVPVVDDIWRQWTTDNREPAR